MAVVYNEMLGHLVRAEAYSEHGPSSYRRAQDALRDSDFAAAQEYGRLTVQEAQEAYDLFADWLVAIPRLLGNAGVAPDQVGASDLFAGWNVYLRLIDEFVAACRSAELDNALAVLELARGTWQHHHDRACDTICEILGRAAHTYGEEVVGSLWDSLLDGMYRRSAQIYDPRSMAWSQSVQRLLLDIFEATRGHLAGAERDGAFEVTEEADRWLIRFAPCGSGGRTLAEEPLRRAVTTKPHDWAWNTAGVCLYCAHCCQLQQRAPIARLGFPLRVIEPPTTHQAQPVCTWSIYKVRADIPDEAYTRVGFAPPGRPQN